jgi:hypothetical protein
MFYKIEIERKNKILFCTIYYIDGMIQQKSFDNIEEVFNYIKLKSNV